MAGLIAALGHGRFEPGARMGLGLGIALRRAEAWAAVLCAHGPDGIGAIGPVFLDLKLHDIPATVAGAVAAVLPLRPSFVTLHAGGGTAMVEAARRAAEPAGDARPKLLAVTVLTSLGAEALHATGVAGGPRQQVLRLARLALAAGVDGLVCSPQEVAMLRDALGGTPLLVVPGVRPEGSPTHDQVRTMTPGEAARAGADYLVIGRPITASADPAATAAAIAAEIA